MQIWCHYTAITDAYPAFLHLKGCKSDALSLDFYLEADKTWKTATKDTGRLIYRENLQILKRHNLIAAWKMKYSSCLYNIHASHMDKYVQTIFYFGKLPDITLY